VLTQLKAVTPSGITYTSVTFTSTGNDPRAAAAAAAGPVGVATGTFNGTAPTYPSVSALLDNLAKVKTFTAPTVTSATEGAASPTSPANVQFGGTVALTAAAKSQRFTKGAGS
jgi:Tfp pilus assembly protein PilN